MKRSTYLKILAGLTISNIIWAFSYAVVGDFYPHLESLKNVLEAKSVFNGLILFMALFFLIPLWNELEN